MPPQQENCDQASQSNKKDGTNHAPQTQQHTDDTSASTFSFSYGQSLNTKAKTLWIHPTTTLIILNVLDMFSVALVVPLLNQYFLDAGVTSAPQREMLSSLFSTSQIIGGIVIGGFLDTGVLSRKHILYLSFLGSSLSYGLVVYGGFRGLIVSRVVVGLIKQTSTISTSMISTYTSKDERTTYMGRLSSCSTFAFIAGPTVGGFLYKNVNRLAPALLASSIFILNFILAALLLPNEDTAVFVTANTKKKYDDNDDETGSKIKKILNNIKTCFTSDTLRAVISSLLIYTWILRATSYASMASYYEEMFGIEPHQRGYIRSYQSALSFIFQTFFISSSLKLLGGEYNAVCVASAAIGFATLLEMKSSLQLFVLIICPIVAIANATLRVSLKSLVTQVAPKDSLGSVLAALDVLQNAAAVTVPFYRTILFQVLACGGAEKDVNAKMSGDPCPQLWLKSSLLHWIIATALLSYLLLKQKLSGQKLKKTTALFEKKVKK